MSKDILTIHFVYLIDTFKNSFAFESIDTDAVTDALKRYESMLTNNLNLLRESSQALRDKSLDGVIALNRDRLKYVSEQIKDISDSNLNNSVNNNRHITLECLTALYQVDLALTRANNTIKSLTKIK